MNKLEVQKRVLKNGEPLSEDLFTWDGNTRTFSSEEDSLVLDFVEQTDCTFKTGWDCTFKTGSGCTFDTSSGCTFDTGSNCTFKTSSGCTFKTGWDCTFKTGSGCTFKTSSGCTFDTSSGCTFDTGSNCTFKTGSGCVVVRRDIYEVIELVEGQTIKLNNYAISGYTVINPEKKIIIDGKDIEISKESFEELKKQLLEEE
jgi:hypothetical protein